jgi:hypothetical protein
VSSLPPLPAQVRARLTEQFGGWDDRLEAVATQMWRAADAVAMYVAERAVMAECRSRADVITAAVLGAKLSDVLFVAPHKAAAMAEAEAVGVKLKSHGNRRTVVQLLGGTKVLLHTLLLQPVARRRPGPKRKPGRRGKAGSGVYPGLAALGITGRVTPALSAEVAREVTEANSVRVATASLAERGLKIGLEPALRLTYLLAGRALEHRQEWMTALEEQAERGESAPSGPLAGRRVVISLDGGRVRLRVPATAGRRNAKTGHRKYKAPWREPKLVTIYTIGPDGKRDTSFPVVLDGTMDDADAAVRLLIAHLRREGAHEAEHVMLIADGADWIWNRAEQIRTALGLTRAQFTEAVDWYHAVEYLGETAKKRRGWTDEERTKWLTRSTKRLKAGNAEGVVEMIDVLRVGRYAKEMKTRREYFDRHKDRMRYPVYREQKLPGGSGAIESGIRRVVNLRMKGNSIFWLEDNAEAMLHLRSHLKAGRWDELVRETIAQPVWKPRPP